MAINVSATADLLLEKRVLVPNIILEIDGIDLIFGALDIEKFVKFGEDNLTYGHFLWGGTTVDENSRDYISMGGTSSQISQQLLPDRGSAQSITTFDLELLDRNQEITQIISPGFVLDEILGVKCKCYMNFQGGAHPEDSILFHRGIITKVASSPAAVKFTIASPERQKRQKVFIQAKTNLSSNFNYRSKLIQSIQYNIRPDVSGSVTIEYTGGNSGGAATVSVIGNAISIQIENAVTTASTIRNRLEESALAMALITLSITSGQSSTAQNTQAPTLLDSDLIINADSTEGFFLPSDSGTHKTYVRIADELIEYTGLTATTFTGLTRGALGTTPEPHDVDEDVTSAHGLNGKCIDLALKLMLSGGDQIWATESVNQFNFVTDVDTRPGAIFFNYFDMTEKRGPVVGDFINITGSTAGNDVSMKQIIAMDKNEFGSWIEVDHVFNTESNSPAMCEFISKYNVLSDGLGMTPEDVDVARHEGLNVRYFSSMTDLEFLEHETINGEEFLPAQLYHASGFYSVPRKTKSSVSLTVPPVSDDEIIFLDETNIEKASQLSPERSVDTDFYNAVIYKYEKDPIEEKFLKGTVRYSAGSEDRIKNIGVKPMTIESNGLRDNTETETILRTNTRRYLERYEYAPEKIKNVQVFSKAGFKSEVGDVVVFGSPELKIADISRGDRNFIRKLYEIQNKKLGPKNQSVSLDLLATNFNLDGRYSIIAPSTIVGTGSTTSQIVVTDSFSTVAPRKEKEKWKNYIGQVILFHNEDWSYQETTTLLGFSPSDDYLMLVDPPLSGPPTAGMTIDPPVYDLGADTEVQQTWKLLHAFFDPQVDVVTGVSNFAFTVAPGDVFKFQVGIPVRVHSDDYLVDSVESKVESIAGSQINLVTDLGFTPAVGQRVELIGFTDGGLPYRYI